MAAPEIGVRKRWSPRAKVNPCHPLAQGLWFHKSPATRGRGTGSISWGVSPQGRALVTANSNLSGYAVPIPYPPVMFDWTMHAIIRMTALDPYSVAVAVPYDPQGAVWQDPYWSIMFSAEFGATYGRMYVNNAGTTLLVDLFTTPLWLTDGNWHSYTGQWGTGGCQVFRDGKPIDSDAATPNGTSSVAPPIIAGGIPELSFATRSVSAPGEGFTGAQSLAAAWTRKLSFQEVAMLHNDPYCMMLR